MTVNAIGGSGRALRGIMRAVLATVVATILACASLSPAWARVIVRPDHSTPGLQEHYIFDVAVERAVPVTQVRIVIPAGLLVFSFGAAPAWQRTVEQNADGTVTAVRWSGSAIQAGEYAEFSVLARNPTRTGRLDWPVVETYRDGKTESFVRTQAPSTLLGADAGVVTPSSGDPTRAGLGLGVAILALALNLLNLVLIILILRRRFA